MRQVEISHNDANQRLDKFLSKAFPLLPKALTYKYIRTKRIKLNGRRASISANLQVGDIIQLYVNDDLLEKKHDKLSFLDAPSELDITYEDANILILNKPAGLLSHPQKGEFADTLISRVQKYLYKKGQYLPDESLSFSPALANRIDRNTSGLVMAAKNAETLRILNQKTKNREIQKLYLCAVLGKMAKDQDTLTAYLIKDEKQNKVKILPYKKANAKEIKTKYKVLAQKGNKSLLEIDLLTGRSHQIRAHLAALGHPLIGDIKYNKASGGTKSRGQLLCAYKLSFNFKADAGPLNYLKNKTFQVENVWFKDEFY